MPRSKEYEVALSFAGEHRGYIGEVARHLRAAGVRFFFDEDERARLWGRDLAEDFQQVFFARSEYVVLFISKAYVDSIWPGIEKRAALAAAISANREYILPVRFDDTEVPGLNPTVRYEDARTTMPAVLADLIMQKLGRNLDLRKGHAVAPPATADLTGTGDFDLTDYDGRYVIGTGHYTFETKWSPGPYIYNDPASISGVAVSTAHEIAEVTDAANQRFNSRARSVPPGSIVVLKNTNGCYAVLKVRVTTQQGSSARLVFDYVIKPDRETDFSKP